ncbi:MAG: hypothetical protein NVS3B12_20930 [Acidimicrobiales bacterium]
MAAAPYDHGVGPSVHPAGWQPLRVPGRLSGPASRSPKQEAFLRLALTHALVMGGDAVVTVALAGSLFFSISPTAARGRVTLSLLFTMAPFAVVAPFLGPAIDRSRGGRRLMLIGSATGRSLACIYMATVVHSLLLFPAALVLLVLSKAHAVAKSSLVPATVHSPGDLVRANGKLATMAAVVGFAAAGPAAIVLKLAGAPWVLRLGAVIYAVGAFMALRCRPAPPAVIDPRDGVDEAARDKGVILASVAMAVLRATVGFLTFAVAFDFRRSHAPSWWYGVVIGASLVGGFIGNLIGPRVRLVLGEERIILGALWAVALAGLFAGRLDSRPGVALLAIVVGLAAAVGRLSFDAILQRDGAEGARGRSFARFEATFQLVWVAAALVPVAAPGSGIPNRVSAFLIAVGAAVAGLYYFAGRRLAGRSARRSPAPTRRRPPGPPTTPVAAPEMWSAVRPAPADVAPAASGTLPNGTIPIGTGSTLAAPRRNPGRSGPPG